ncbi:SDR family NAD(P)-dependent oxidoreductase [Paractinoplanes aksuensis]|uniref:SDR family NAD(P)-dependent oxidoreductase n=1 Tax=Paractinoplanes aksuensis TaxID=2939490 RepID=UPI00209C3BB3|nr:SDR family NAD(P)-dependent oxidoreductase [Actinoplanes aksuensis]
MSRLNGKVVMITGVGKGLGRQNAIRMAQEGASLAISDRHEERLAETAALCAETGAKVLSVVCDVTKPGHLENCGAAVVLITRPGGTSSSPTIAVQVSGSPERSSLSMSTSISRTAPTTSWPAGSMRWKWRPYWPK